MDERPCHPGPGLFGSARTHGGDGDPRNHPPTERSGRPPAIAVVDPPPGGHQLFGPVSGYTSRQTSWASFDPARLMADDTVTSDAAATSVGRATWARAA